MKKKCKRFTQFPWTSQMIVENRHHGHAHLADQSFRDFARKRTSVSRIIDAMIHDDSSFWGPEYWDRKFDENRRIHIDE